MALLTSTMEIPQRMDRIRYPEVDLRRLSLSSSSSEIVEGRLTSTSSISSSSPSSSIPSPIFSPALRDIDEAVYVAVGKEVKESEIVLSWTLHNCGGRKTIILHVHQPSQKICIMGANVPISRLEEHRVRAHHDVERQDMEKLLDKYMLICKKAGVQVDKLYIEMDSIEKGIVELISLHGIKKLVMGGAAKRHYERKMLEPRSKKAIYVRLQAPAFCQIRFICKGHLIHTREGTPTGINRQVMSPLFQPSPSGTNLEVISTSFQASPSNETEQSHSLRSRSVYEGQNDQLQLSGSVPDHRRVVSDNHSMTFIGVSPRDSIGGLTPHSRLSVQGSTDGCNGMSRRSPSVASQLSSCSSRELIDDSASVSTTRMEGIENELDGDAPHHSDKDYCDISPYPIVREGTMYDELYDRLQQSMEEAEISRREAYEESMRRRKAEKEAIEARRRAKASETMYSEEFRHRKEVEEALAKHKEEVENLKCQLDEIKEKLRISMEQKSSLECQIATSDTTIQELEQKMFSAVELLQKYKKEREDLQVERDNSVREAEELRKKQAEEASSASMSCFFSEYSFWEIEEATHNFDPALKIGEGCYGSIYKGLLHHTQVSIKILHPHSLQGPSAFQQEVNILSKLRHPNLVTLIGACPDFWALIHEYLPNGSLEDRLSCKDNTPPLSWQTRIRIASELCSVLIFLHSCSPRSIVHGDLKPEIILLDTNFVSKLTDFGICRVLGEDEFSDNTALSCRTDQIGTFAYMDPEFLATGELTPKSDVYSFGIILLRLLTGKPALGIHKEVQSALNNGNLKDILDSTAGDWPFVQAQQLAHLAMSCCEMTPNNRPELASEIWRMLEPMRASSCGTSSSSRLISEEQSQIPSYFICPIFQEVMQDPVVAADGFTYEAEALKGWLDSGHDTSPMTNLKLEHCNLVPNHALRSAIQEWLQQP